MKQEFDAYVCYKCHLVYDLLNSGLYTLDNWNANKKPIVEGDYDYCCRIFKLKAFI
jgi:hypothetical protein